MKNRKLRALFSAPLCLTMALTLSGGSAFAASEVDSDPIVETAPDGTFEPITDEPSASAPETTSKHDAGPIVGNAGEESDRPSSASEPDAMARAKAGESIAFLADDVQPRAAGVVYVDGQNGSDSRDGATESTPVKTLDRAVELAGENGTVIFRNYVYLKDGATHTLENVTLRRGNPTGMLSVSDNTTLVLGAGVTVDGNKEIATGRVTAIQLNTGSNLVIEEGARIVNSSSNAIRTMGQVIESKGSTITMRGGEISGNGDSSVVVEKMSTFIMEGGVITGNETNDGGGGVYVDEGRFVMTGGSVNGNSAAEAGGGICIADGSAELKGGTVEGNLAGWGGGIAVTGSGTTVIDGASIVDNESNGNGGGVYLEGFETGWGVADECVVIVKSGTIAGNVAGSTNGDGIYGWAAGVTTRVEIEGGTIAADPRENVDTRAIAMEGDLGFDYTHLKLSGSPDIEGGIAMPNNNFPDIKIDVVDTFTPANPVRVIHYTFNDGDVFATYADGLAARASDFTLNGAPYYSIAEDGQNLYRLKMTIVDVWNWVPEVYDAIFIVPNATVDPADIPQDAIAKPGFIMSGWKVATVLDDYGALSEWRDWDPSIPVDVEHIIAHPQWKLSPASFELASDKGAVHVVDGEAELSIAIEPAQAPNVSNTWSWYKDGVLVPGSENAERLTIHEAGTYRVVMTASDGTSTADPSEQTIVIASEDHVWGDWLFDAGKHWKECAVCGEHELEGPHTFGDWTVTKEPTATEAGSKAHRCTSCEYSETVEIPASGVKPEPLPKPEPQPAPDNGSKPADQAKENADGVSSSKSDGTLAKTGDIALPVTAALAVLAMGAVASIVLAKRKTR